MSKQLRIWLFVLLGTLLTSTSLLAENVITMTTTKKVGETIKLYIKANGNVTIEGAQETGETDDYGHKSYTIKSQTITIRGDVTTLKCFSNQLTSLDVSKNTALTELKCSFNRLTSLNVSGCTALTELYCSNNQLTSLNLSGCTALTELNCSDNQLTSLNVSGCAALTELGCSGNQLTSLNLSGCTALTWLDCSGNQLTSLNVSGCTALTTLYCDNNQLISLNVSGCTALTKLDCSYNQLISLNVSGCTALTKLNCFGNQLTSLNVAGCTALTELSCSVNQLTSLDLSGCTALTMLDCHLNQLTSLNVSGCTALTTLKCWNNKLTSLDLSKNSALATIDCSDNKLPSLDLSGHKALTALNCSKNLLRKLDLSGCTSIILLTCHRNQIKAPEMANLVNSLPDLQGKGVGLFKVFYDGSGEGNVCLAAHIATAQAKGWKTQFTRSYYDDAWYDYTGADNALYAVSSWSTFGGSISFTGADNLNAVPYGTELTVVATPAYGYKLTKLTANGKDILETKRFEVTENTRVEATFEKKSFAVSLTKEGEGTITATGASNLNSVAYGTELTINATPAKGYELTALTANGTDILATKKIVVTDNLNVKATFANKKFAVTLTSNEHGKITIAEPVDLKVVPYGTKLTVKATGKNAQCVLTALTANGEDILATQSFVVKGATEVKATFVDHTGVETTVTQQTQLYPNPATDYVIVEGVAPASEVTLHSMTGERLYADRADSRGTLRIDLTPYADGVYLVCVADETYRVVVRH